MHFKFKKIILLECLLIGILILSSCTLTERNPAIENSESEGTEISEEPEMSEETEIIGEPEIGPESVIGEEGEAGNDTVQDNDSDKKSLEDLNIHPLYAAFLCGEISVANPYVFEGSSAEFSFFHEQEYDSEFENAIKSFALVDVNGDGGEELIFVIESDDNMDKLLFILGIRDDKLICYDVFESHTTRRFFSVYDNGNAWFGQSSTGQELVYYTYDGDGNPIELIHFYQEWNSDSGLRYDYYYLDGNEEKKVYLDDDDEFWALELLYAGNEPEWYQCESFSDIPEW